MRCPACRAENAEGRRFCGDCGSPLAGTCSTCGFANQPGARFCGGCGVRLTGGAPSTASPEEGELRQVTVMFADLSGFTELSGRIDPEEVHGLLCRFFETADGAIERFGGTIDKHIGDCAMGVFGARVAHSNDPERAVRAALAIHQTMPEIGPSEDGPLQAHIGIACGPVVASGTGSAHHREHTVTGASVNLASRLTGLAGPGETLISDDVRTAVSDLYDSTAVGNVSVKGIDRPVKVWRLGGPRTAHSKSRSRPFVGRRVELHQFLGVLDACRETGSGLTVHIRGEAGIGKTRLVEEFRSRAADRGFSCHTGLVLDFGVATGHDAIRAVVRSVLGISAGGDEAEARRAAEAAIVDGLVEADRRVYLNDFLDLPQEARERAVYDAMDNPARNRGKQETVAMLVRRASARRPLMITVEDVHWADGITLAHLASLSAAVADCPAILTVTSRIDGNPIDNAWRTLTGNSPLLTIDLSPLRRLDALKLAGSLFDATDPLVLACVDRSGGNPLFLEQLLRNAGEAGADDVPPSVQSIVLARMDRLATVDRQALQAASVIGQRFSLDSLRYLMGDGGYDCAGLIQHHLVRSDGDGFLFAHALIQEGVYGSLLRARRRDLHRRAADWFVDRDPVLCAEHLDRADDPTAPRAYLRAAETQAAAYRTERALQLVERGLAIATQQADRFALTNVQGDLLHAMGSIGPSIAAFERAFELAEDDAGRCRAWLGLAGGLRVTDDYDRALDVLSKAELAATAAGLVAERSLVHHLRGNLYFPVGWHESCREQHELALNYARQAGSPELVARALGGLGDAAYAEGRMLTAERAFRRCIDVCQAEGFGRIEVANLPMAALGRFYAHDLQGARDDALAAIALATQVGHHRAEIIAQHIAHIVSHASGEHHRAAEHARRAHHLSTLLGAKRFEAESLLFFAKIAEAQGERAEAREHLHEALRICRATGMEYMGAAILGAIAAASDDEDERRSALEEGQNLLARGVVSHNHFWFYADAMAAALAAEDWDGTDRFAAALEAYTAAEPLPWSDFLIAKGRVLARLGRGARDDETGAELRRLRDEAERVGLRLELATLDALLTGSRR